MARNLFNLFKHYLILVILCTYTLYITNLVAAEARYFLQEIVAAAHYVY